MNEILGIYAGGGSWAIGDDEREVELPASLNAGVNAGGSETLREAEGHGRSVEWRVRSVE
jgi:hypothetical protein